MKIHDLESAIVKYGEDITLKNLLLILKNENKCKKCDGSGKVFIHSYFFNSVIHTCYECDGEGYVYK